MTTEYFEFVNFLFHFDKSFKKLPTVTKSSSAHEPYEWPDIDILNKISIVHSSSLIFLVKWIGMVDAFTLTNCNIKNRKKREEVRLNWTMSLTFLSSAYTQWNVVKGDYHFHIAENPHTYRMYTELL